MNNSPFYTQYQSGTLLHHALLKSGGKRNGEVAIHFAMPIQEDNNECWLETYPEELKISKAAAAEARRKAELLESHATKIHEARRRASPIESYTDHGCLVDRDRFMYEALAGNIGFAKTQSQLDQFYTIIPEKSYLRQHASMKEAFAFCEGHFSSIEYVNGYAYILSTHVSQPNAYVATYAGTTFIENVTDLMSKVLASEAVAEYNRIRDEAFRVDLKTRKSNDSLALAAIIAVFALLILLAVSMK